MSHARMCAGWGQDKKSQVKMRDEQRGMAGDPRCTLALSACVLGRRLFRAKGQEL